MSNHRMISTLIALLFAFALLSQAPAYAQDNLLQNGGFNGSGQYVDRRPADSDQPFAIAPGWGGWQTVSPSTESWMNIRPIAFPHTSESKTEGDASQNVGRGGGTFTAAVYQTVNDIPEGTTLRFSAWVFQENDSGKDARTRVGIGSNVNGNPLAGSIVWSDWTYAIRSWQELTIEATVPQGSVTVFLYSTQNAPNDPNQVYYDDARLVVAGAGDVNVESGEPNIPAPVTSTPRPAFAPFVSAQDADDSGRIEHIVRSGDTLAGIAVAYGITLTELLEINGLERGSVLQVGQSILIKRGGDTPTEVPPTEEPAAETTTEVAAAATEQATEVPAPTESEPTAIPSATPIPPTATDAPPAPVESGANNDPLALEAAICVTMFDDQNQNSLRDGEEPLLAGGEITLEPEVGGSVEQYTTDGTSEPYCFLDLETGSYVVSAVAPAGYGLRSQSLLVNVPPGQQFSVRFSAVEGLEVASIPTPDTLMAAEADAAIQNETEAGGLSNLRNIAGIIVLGLAGVVLIAGVGIAILTGRR